jgi:hypothetical protein
VHFFPISRVVSLRSEVLSFKQEEQESLDMAWEYFNALINTGPDLAIQDPILLQHFYMGLDRKTSKRLDTASGSVTPIFKDKNRMYKRLMCAPGHDRTHK